MSSCQNGVFSLIRGFAVCPLVRGVIGEHDKNDAKGNNCS